MLAHLDGSFTLYHVVQHFCEGVGMTVVEVFIGFTLYEAYHGRTVFDRLLK